MCYFTFLNVFANCSFLKGHSSWMKSRFKAIAFILYSYFPSPRQLSVICPEEKVTNISVPLMEYEPENSGMESLFVEICKVELSGMIK